MEKWKYVNNVIRSSSIDQNRDGEADAIYRYDLRGELTSFESDSNFDGRFENECQFRQGNLTVCLTDEDGDGFSEYRERYKHGVIATLSIFDRETRQLKKKQYFEIQRLKHAEIDIDGDGILETKYDYDVFEEPVSKER